MVAANNMVAGALNTVIDASAAMAKADYSGLVPAVNNTLETITTIPSLNDVKESVTNVQNWENGVAGAAMFYVGGGTKTMTNIENVANSISQTAKVEVAGAIKNVLNEGENSVTIDKDAVRTRYDLAGKAHNGIETPHKQSYKWNENPATGQGKFSRDSKQATPMSSYDLFKVSMHLIKQK